MTHARAHDAMIALLHPKHQDPEPVDKSADGNSHNISNISETACCRSWPWAVHLTWMWSHTSSSLGHTCMTLRGYHGALKTCRRSYSICIRCTFSRSGTARWTKTMPQGCLQPLPHTSEKLWLTSHPALLLPALSQSSTNQGSMCATGMCRLCIWTNMTKVLSHRYLPHEDKHLLHVSCSLHVLY